MICFTLLMKTLLMVSCYVTSMCCVEVAKPSDTQVKFLDYEIGATIHFNMQTFDGSMKPGQVASPDVFNPVQLSTDQWLRAASSFGAKHAILTLDHASGFLLWPTQTDYYYSVKNTEWRNKTADVALDFVQSCKKFGIKHGYFYSVHENWYMDIDHFKATNPAAQAVYNQLAEQHMKELFDPKSKYANPFIMWFDSGIAPGISPNIGPILRTLGNNTVCMQCPTFAGNQGARWVGNEEAVAPLPLWYAVPAGKCFWNQAHSGDPLGEQFCPPFCDTVIREHYWFWEPNTTSRVKSVSTLIGEYLTSVGRGCHMTLNLNPDRNGLIEDQDLEAYKGLGEAINLLYRDLVMTVKNPEVKVGVDVVLSFQKPLIPGNGSVVIMEDIAQFGQLVAEYQLWFKTLQGWIESPEKGSSIGFKRIHAIPDMFNGNIISAVSLNITRLVTNGTSLMLHEISVYDWTEAARKGFI